MDNGGWDITWDVGHAGDEWQGVQTMDLRAETVVVVARRQAPGPGRKRGE